VDRSAHLVRLNGHELKLTATEYALLVVLVQHAGKVVPHRTILKEVWGPNSVEHNHYLRVYFGQIRKKMEAVLPGSSDILQNESGIGYRLRT
jgi:two-component system KDP operon response regulator KdpE